MVVEGINQIKTCIEKVTNGAVNVGALHWNWRQIILPRWDDDDGAEQRRVEQATERNGSYQLFITK